MKTKDIRTGTSYAHQNTKWAPADQIWVLSKDTYQYDSRADNYPSEGLTKYTRVDRYSSKLSSHRYSYGMLAVVWDYHYVSLEKELVEILNKLTLEQVLAAQGIPTSVKEAFNARDRGAPKVRVLMARYIVKDWATYKTEEEQQRNAALDRQERIRARREDQMERRESVINVLNKVLATEESPEPIYFSKYDRQDKIEIYLDDAERLVELLKHVLPSLLQDS